MHGASAHIPSAHYRLQAIRQVLCCQSAVKHAYIKNRKVVCCGQTSRHLEANFGWLRAQPALSLHKRTQSLPSFLMVEANLLN